MNMPAGAAEANERNMAGRKLGRYEVLTQLAAGGMAGVYVGRAQGVAGFERLVAIKVLHPHLAYEEEFISMFLDEARLAARIRHPNVVPTLDISDSEGDGYFLVMDYIEGDHLGALLGRSAKAGRRLPAPVVCRVLIDALNGLGAAHRLNDEKGEPLNLVHRDVSPHNVMVGTDGIGRLTDFGVAKAEVRMASTRAGQFKGKLSYMAPEQASTGNATQQSDLFSMGIILWESLTGRRLFRGENNAATLTKILQAPIPKASELWSDLTPYDEVLTKALEREPEKRYQSAEDFAEAIEEAARADEGVASQRAVATQVRELISEKLDKESSRIKQAIESMGRAEIGEALMPIPRGTSASSLSNTGSLPSMPGGTQSGQRPVPPPPPPLPGQTGSYVGPPPVQESGGNKALRTLVAVLFLIAAAGGGALAWQLSREEAPPPIAATAATPEPEPTVISMTDQEAADAEPELTDEEIAAIAAEDEAARAAEAEQRAAQQQSVINDAVQAAIAAERDRQIQQRGARRTGPRRGGPRQPSQAQPSAATAMAPAAEPAPAPEPTPMAAPTPMAQPANDDIFVNPYLH